MGRRVYPGVPEPEHPWERRPVESSEAFAAFVLYRDLGPSRKLAEVQRMRQASGRTQLERWSSWHEWVARCSAWDAECDRNQRERDQVEATEGAKAMWEEHMRTSREIWKAARNTLMPDDEAELKKKLAELPGTTLLRMIETGMEREARSRLRMAGRGIDPGDARKLTDELISIALRYVPEESQGAFLAEIESWASV